MTKEKIAVTLDKDLIERLGENRSADINDILKNHFMYQDEKDKKIQKIIDYIEKRNNDAQLIGNLKIINDNIEKVKKSGDIQFYITTILILIAMILIVLIR